VTMVSPKKRPPSSRSGTWTEKTYSFDDLRIFADLSGDRNPLHLDRSSSRRELFGGVVVHGVRVILDSMEMCAPEIARLRKPFWFGRIRCMFLNPVFPNEPIKFKCDETAAGSWHVEVRGSNGALLVESNFVVSSSVPPTLPALPATKPSPQEHPAEHSINEIKNMCGKAALTYNRRQTEGLFPRLAKTAPPAQIAELLCLTRLVGMECPGLRSVLSSFDLRFDASFPVPPDAAYRVVAVNERFLRADIELHGPYMKGTIITFVRPGPQQQPSFSQVKKRIDRLMLTNQPALIIGGTRGLGEITAKIIAACGGYPVITYFSGARDAERIKTEILAGGGRCAILAFDATQPGKSRKNLEALGLRFPAVYYFATPKIFVKKGSSFDATVFSTFNSFYVTGINDTYALVRSLYSGPLVFFNPSSTAIDEKIPELMEYALSKKASEELCGYLAARDKQLKIVVKRLPRTATDQTITLTGVPAADAVEVMLPIVKEIHGLQDNP
jgi:acyl dehydratase